MAKKPALNMRYYNHEIDDDLPYVGQLKLDKKTGYIYDEEGDVVELTVTAYIFAGRAPSISSVYFTNEESVLKSLSSEGLNTEYWTTEPVVVKLGESSIIKGVEQSLLGCREGDKVEVYMTHNAAYEDKAMGILKKESPVMWIYTITNLIKN